MTTIVEDSASEIGLRERKKKQTRAAIHEAAFRLIEQQGLEATTIEQICSEADVSSRTFFNYYPSKAAAAFELAGAGIDDDIIARFRAADGGLVDALCDAIGDSAEHGASHTRMKNLMLQRPELIATLSQMMHEVRGQYIALATERAASQDEAELAVTLVMAALAKVMHTEQGTDLPLGVRLRTTVARLVAVGTQPLAPIVDPS
jgi:AcrR family transcriptional regulator